VPLDACSAFGDFGDNATAGPVGRANGLNSRRPTLPPIDEADIARWAGCEPEEISFSIADLVPQGMVTLLTSQGGAGKTLLMQMAVAAVAAGTLKFLGRQCTAGSAAGVFAEDPDQVLHLRQSRINAQWGIDYDRLAGRAFIQSYFGLPAQLWRQGRATPFMGELEEHLRQIENLRLLTLDNAALLYAGDESSRPEVTEFLAMLNGVADRLAIGIVLSAHASKSSDGTALRLTSGSTAWVNACRSVLELKPGEDPQTATLTLVKANHAASGAAIDLEWRDKLLVPVASATGIIGTIERRNCEHVFLDLLAATTSEGQPISSSSRASNYAPRLFMQRTASDRQGFKTRDFELAMQALFSGRQIVNVPYGRKGDDRMKIARSAP
jgi:hypothetical protein